MMLTVWPDWAIFCCLDDFLKQVETTILAQIAHIIRLFLKKCNYSSEGILGSFLNTLGDF